MMTRFDRKINNQDAFFAQLFSSNNLIKSFEENFSDSKLRGYDGLSAQHVDSNLDTIFESVTSKCDSGQFRFTPYKEKLISKGRNNCPRMVSIPTVRDRVVLKQLQRFLSALYPEITSQSQPREVILPVIKYVKSNFDDQLWVYSGDVQKFYDSISHEVLFSILQERIQSKQILSLIHHAIITPTLPTNTPKKYYNRYKSSIGVPQGLSIAGMLASIYMMHIDQAIKDKHPDIFYTRYVDDILIIGKQTEVSKAEKTLLHTMQSAKLTLHTASTKMHLNRITEPFQFLGYAFSLPQKISVRESSVNRLKKRIINLFSQEKHQPYDHFMAKLNVRITGFIETSNGEYFGWLSYFKEMNDLTLLYELDSFINKQFKTLKHYDGKAPDDLKSFVRSYYEAKHSHKGGYIPQFTREDVPQDWLKEIIDDYVTLHL